MEKSIVVKIVSDGTISVEDEPCALDQLASKLSELGAFEVVVRATLDAPQDMVNAVLMACGKAGVKQGRIESIR